MTRADAVVATEHISSLLRSWVWIWSFGAAGVQESLLKPPNKLSAVKVNLRRLFKTTKQSNSKSTYIKHKQSRANTFQ